MRAAYWKKLRITVVSAGLALALTLAPGPASAQKPASDPGPAVAATGIEALAQEYEAIAKVIEAYIEGGRQGSGEAMKLAFLPGANVFGFLDGQLVGGSVQMLYDLVDSRPAAGDIPYKIVRLEAMEDVAMVRVDIDDWNGAKYCDMFTLVKADGEWKISSKVSHKF